MSTRLIKSLKSWFVVDRSWSHLRPLVKALRTPPYDLAALAALYQFSIDFRHSREGGNPVSHRTTGYPLSRE